MIPTPYYLIDQKRLQTNLQRIDTVRRDSGAKIVLALKCFATWGVFDLMRPCLDGTTSSSLYEARLGHEKFGGETHAYSVAWSDQEVDAVLPHTDKLIFNSLSQLERYAPKAGGKPLGLRINPGFSVSGHDLADPARPFSRLGEQNPERIAKALGQLSGFMIHNNCENRDFDRFEAQLSRIEEHFGELIRQLDWISLGGGIHFTDPAYPLSAFCARLKDFSKCYGVQVYLEPGEAAVHDAATLEVTVLDVLDRGKSLAILDASTEAHMLDLLIYRESAQIEPNLGPHRHVLCGRSCLAGDIFGEFDFPAPLKAGDRLSLRNAASYTMVKKNWFNGLSMPAIALRDEAGQERLIRQFSFEDYVSSLS